MLKEFKTFISKGNVIDLAVGVIIGSAFSKIVSSLVDNVIMPLFGFMLGGLNFSSLTFSINDASINYGIFIQNIVGFLIISFCLFMFIKFINKLTHKKEQNEKKEVTTLSDETLLLREIRDLLKEKK